MKRYVGVDLHTNSITACYLESDKEPRFQTYQLTAGGLRCDMATLIRTQGLN